LLSISTGIAKAETVGNFAVLVRATYNQALTPPIPNVLARVSLVLLDEKFSDLGNSRSTPVGGTALFEVSREKIKSVDVAISRKSASIAPTSESVCASAIFAYESTWRSAIGLSEPPDAQEILLTNTSNINNCPFASLLMIMAGAATSEDRRRAGGEVSRIMNRPEITSALVEQWIQFLQIPNFEIFSVEGRFNLIKILEHLDPKKLDPEHLQALRERLGNISTEALRMRLGPQTVDTLTTISQKFTVQ
jgi:hypothetical protein